MRNTTEILNTFGTGVVNRFRSVVASKGGNASGTMSKEARYGVDQGADKLSLTVDTVEYFKYADEGRGKTVNSGDGAVKRNIRKWIDQKGISPRGLNKDELAFLIARKIHREGYKGKLYVKDVVDEPFKKEMDKQIADAIIKDFNF